MTGAGGKRGTSLGAATAIAFAIVAVLVLGSSATLVAGTAKLHGLVVEQQNALESVRAAEQLRVELLLLERAGADHERIDHRGRIEELLTEYEDLVTSPAERMIVDEARVAVDAYLATESPASANASLDALNRLSALNVENARIAERRAADVDRVGAVVGTTVGGMLVIGIALVALWLRLYLLGPIRALERTIRTFAQGDRHARADVAGPHELRTIAGRFNEMSEALAGERDRRVTFLAAVAHDLRNPISALQLAVATVPADGPLPPESRVRALLAIIGRQVARLSRMTNDFLDSARIDSGEIEIERAEVDLREAAAEAIELFEPVSPRHRLMLEAEEGRDLRAAGDAARIAQVLNNLLSNAIKYSPDGGSVRIRIGRDRSSVVIEVTDEGIGISPEDREKVFEPFRRAGPSKEAIPGVGLGLHSTRAIVAAHGGEIAITSELGRGTTFRVSLPGAPVPAGDAVTERGWSATRATPT